MRNILAAIAALAVLAGMVPGATIQQEATWRDNYQALRAGRARLVSLSQQVVKVGDDISAVRATWIAQRDDPETPATDKAKLAASISQLDAELSNVQAFYQAAKAFRDAQQK